MRNEKTTDLKTDFITKEAIVNFVNKKNQFNVLPTYAGYYRIGCVAGLSISLDKKPNWMHRKLMAICLGWEWIDNK